MVLLGVNIDHVATVRQARRGPTPDLLEAAEKVVSGGADSITIHLREDRRHIQDVDVANLKRTLKVRLNLEMAPTEDMVRIARLVRPHSVCLVPEKRQELTTEGGLNVKDQLRRMREVCKKLKSKGIIVSLFVDPVSAQLQAAKEAEADFIELHTGTYSNAETDNSQMDELEKLKKAAELAQQLGLKINAGHGLDYNNVQPIAVLPGMNELNIGFSIVSRALFVGLETAVKEMKSLVKG